MYFKTKPTPKETATQPELGDDGYVVYNANAQGPYAELRTHFNSTRRSESTTVQPVIGEDGYTEYNRTSDQQESYEELQKGTSPDTKGTSASNTDYEVHIDFAHGAMSAEAEDEMNNDEDNEYAYAYADVPKTDQ
ncbi:uncharacterized protein [Amphiura filiformis]|uniref:uncharacterized protein n=1 Tax=Amphiura filiformis TaxID=82378 RepID=UPI003B21C161